MSTDPARLTEVQVPGELDVRLTDDEREDLWRAYESWTEGDFSEHMGEAVEKMLPGRLAEAWERGHRDVCTDCNCRPEWNPYRTRGAS